MDFKETYRHEVYLSRKDRARRALFAAKLTGIALVVTIGATLRAEPELRSMLFTAGMDGVASFANLNTPAVATSTLPPLGQQIATLSESQTVTQGIQEKRETGGLPTSRVKVNRPAVAPAADTPMSEHLAKALARMGQGG